MMNLKTTNKRKRRQSNQSGDEKRITTENEDSRIKSGHGDRMDHEQSNRKKFKSET